MGLLCIFGRWCFIVKGCGVCPWIYAGSSSSLLRLSSDSMLGVLTTQNLIFQQVSKFECRHVSTLSIRKNHFELNSGQSSIDTALSA